MGKINVLHFFKQLDIFDFKDVKFFPFLPTDKETISVRLREIEWLAPQLTSGFNLEFGVYSGKSINHFAKYRPDLHFIGFDSFKGLPEEWDLGTKIVSKKAFDLKGKLPKVADNVSLIKGFFDKSLPLWLKTNHDLISFINIDSDIYSSALTVLNLLNHLIVPGTIIRFDELSCWRSAFNEPSPKNFNRLMYPHWKQHEWKALNEWIDAHNRIVKPISRDWFQSGTIVVQK